MSSDNNNNEEMDSNKSLSNDIGKIDFESNLVDSAYESVVKSGNIDPVTQKKFSQIKNNIAKICSPKVNANRNLPKGTIKKNELMWEIGFTPHNFENLVYLSEESSKIDFYKKYNISKTVFYAYMRGKASPSYKNWKKLLEQVLETTDETDTLMYADKSDTTD